MEELDLLKPLEFVAQECSTENHVTVSKNIPLIRRTMIEYQNMRQTMELSTKLKGVIPIGLERWFDQLEFVDFYHHWISASRPYISGTRRLLPLPCVERHDKSSHSTSSMTNRRKSNTIFRFIIILLNPKKKICPRKSCVCICPTLRWHPWRTTLWRNRKAEECIPHRT